MYVCGVCGFSVVTNTLGWAPISSRVCVCVFVCVCVYDDDVASLLFKHSWLGTHLVCVCVCVYDDDVASLLLQRLGWAPISCVCVLCDVCCVMWLLFCYKDSWLGTHLVCVCVCVYDDDDVASLLLQRLLGGHPSRCQLVRH